MFNNTRWTREEIEAQEGVLSKVTQKLSDLKLGKRAAGITPTPVLSSPAPIGPGPEGGSQRAAGLSEPVGSPPGPFLWDSKTNRSSGLGELPVTPLTLCDLRRAREPLRASAVFWVQSTSRRECDVYADVFPTGLWAVLVPPTSPVHSRCSTNVLLLCIYLVTLLAHTACWVSSQ